MVSRRLTETGANSVDIRQSVYRESSCSKEANPHYKSDPPPSHPLHLSSIAATMALPEARLTSDVPLPELARGVIACTGERRARHISRLRPGRLTGSCMGLPCRAYVA